MVFVRRVDFFFCVLGNFKTAVWFYDDQIGEISTLSELRLNKREYRNAHSDTQANAQIPKAQTHRFSRLSKIACAFFTDSIFVNRFVRERL